MAYDPLPSDAHIVPEISTPAAVETSLPIEQRADGTRVINLLPLVPPPVDCSDDEADPFSSDIIVCRKTALSPRLGKGVGPEVDDFGNAIPRARLKLSENAEAQANLINKDVGGWNANGAEVRLKIDF
jgi:hypothetical protein